MNIRWNAFERRFEAEFSSDFNGDLSAVKTAGFRTDGPPVWVWHTQKIAALNKLREKKPSSGLTITPEALEIYKPLALQEEQNQVVKKQLADFKKKANKERKAQAQEAASGTVLAGLTDEKWWIGAEDLPPLPPYVSSHQPTSEWLAAYTGLRCIYCTQPVLPFERQQPPICLWCEKTIIDKDFPEAQNNA